jgi:hypothetical protein
LKGGHGAKGGLNGMKIMSRQLSSKRSSRSAQL